MTSGVLCSGSWGIPSLSCAWLLFSFLCLGAKVTNKAGNYLNGSNRIVSHEPCLVLLHLYGSRQQPEKFNNRNAGGDPGPHTLQETLVCPWPHPKPTLLALIGQSFLPTQNLKTILMVSCFLQLLEIERRHSMVQNPSAAECDPKTLSSEESRQIQVQSQEPG